MTDIVRRWDKAIEAGLDRLKRRGQIGRINASGTPTVEVPGSGGRLVYVRLGPDGADGTIEAVPRNVPARAHTYVKVFKEDGEWKAVSDDSAISQNGSGSAAVAPHTHRRHSGLEYIVEAEMFSPGVVLPAGGLTVSIGRFRYPNSGNGETYEGGTLDLTSHVPATAGKWRWVLVGVDPDTNAAVAVSGSDFDTQAELTLAEIDNVTFTGDIPLAAIQVANGDTALTNISRYYDAKTWYVPADAIDQGDFLLLAGRSGGQVGYGGTGDGDALTLAGSSHANGGPLLLQPDGGDTFLGGNVGIGINPPGHDLDIERTGETASFRLGTTDGSTAIMIFDRGQVSGTARFSFRTAGTPIIDMGIGSNDDSALYFGNSGLASKYLSITTSGNIGIGISSSLGAKLHIDQASTTAAIPVLLLDQADLSHPFISFQTTVGAGNPVNTSALGSYYGRVRVHVVGVGDKWLALYDT